MNNKKMMSIADEAGVIRSHDYHELKNKLAYHRLNGGCSGQADKTAGDACNQPEGWKMSFLNLVGAWILSSVPLFLSIVLRIKIGDIKDTEEGSNIFFSWWFSIGLIMFGFWCLSK